MAGITIIGFKVIDKCSKCRTKDDEIPRYKDGSIIPDDMIACCQEAL